MAHSSRAKLRSAVTGEPYQLAAEWIAEHGLADGLVPQAQLPDQQLAEAAVLVALARPRVLPVLAPAGSLYALAAAEPGLSRLTLRPAEAYAAEVLARLLPATTGGSISGVPLLRTGKITNTTIALRLLAPSSDKGVQLSIRATRAHRLKAERLQAEAGLVPLWTGQGVGNDEPAAWQSLARSLAGSQSRWSQALRRPALFRSACPDWSTSAPTVDEVTGPLDLSRFEPRSVAPRASRPGGRAPIVAVTVDGGGTGGTTVALGVAAALARKGLHTAVILEPGLLDGPLAEHVGSTGDWAVLDSPAAGILEAVTRHPRKLGQQLRAAQERADVAVVDPTGATVGEVRLPVAPEVRVMLAPAKSVWGGWLWRQRQTLDHRPAKVKMAAWLSERCKHFTQDYLQVHPPTRTESLLELLDQRFTLVAADRRSESPAEYAESDSLYSEVLDDEEWLEEWWDHNSRSLDCDPDEVLTPEDDVPDSWRSEFLQQMDPEGRRRFGSVWEEAASAWPARSRARQRLGLRPTDLDPKKAGQIRRAFLQNVADEAGDQWGDLWPGHAQTWASAEANGQDLTAGWEGDIEIQMVRRMPDAVAADLTSVLSKSHAWSPSTAATTVFVRNQVRREDRGTDDELAAVAACLAHASIAAVCEIPLSMTVREKVGGALLTPQPALAAAFDRMADLVTADCLSSSARDVHDGPSTDIGRTDQGTV